MWLKRVRKTYIFNFIIIAFVVNISVSVWSQQTDKRSVWSVSPFFTHFIILPYLRYWLICSCMWFWNHVLTISYTLTHKHADGYFIYWNLAISIDTFFGVFFFHMMCFKWHNLIYSENEMLEVMQCRNELTGEQYALIRFRARLPLPMIFWSNQKSNEMEACHLQSESNGFSY